MHPIRDEKEQDRRRAGVERKVMLAAINHEIQLAEKEVELIKERLPDEPQHAEVLKKFGRAAWKRANRLKSAIDAEHRINSILR